MIKYSLNGRIKTIVGNKYQIWKTQTSYFTTKYYVYSCYSWKISCLFGWADLKAYYFDSENTVYCLDHELALLLDKEGLNVRMV